MRDINNVYGQLNQFNQHQQLSDSDEDPYGDAVYGPRGPDENGQYGEQEL